MSDFSNIEDLIIPTETLEYKDGRYRLWPLNTAQVVSIIRSHGTTLVPLYDQAVQGRMPADIGAVAYDMGDTFSGLAGAMIAHSMGKPDALAVTSKLPFAVQLDAIDKIMRLTMETEGGLGKVVEIVTKTLAALSAYQKR